MDWLKKFCLIFLSLILVLQLTAAEDVVKESSVSYVDGTEPDMDSIYLDVEQQDPYMYGFWLKSEEETVISVEGEGPGNVTVHRDLAPTGADRSTTFEVEIVFDDFVPRMLQGAANDMDWEREYRDDGTVKATVEVNPIENPMMTGHQTMQDWPEGEDDRADYVLEEHVRFLISNAERQSGRFFKERVNGTVVGSDGTTGTPDLRTDDMDNEQLVVPVAGPHYDVDGSKYGEGTYYTVLPENTLEMWNVTSTDDLEAWYEGNETSFTATELEDGRMKIEMSPSYSVVELAIGTEWVELTLWQELIWRIWNEARGYLLGFLASLSLIVFLIYKRF